MHRTASFSEDDDPLGDHRDHQQRSRWGRLKRSHSHDAPMPSGSELRSMDGLSTPSRPNWFRKHNSEHGGSDDPKSVATRWKKGARMIILRNRGVLKSRSAMLGGSFKVTGNGSNSHEGRVSDLDYEKQQNLPIFHDDDHDALSSLGGDEIQTSSPRKMAPLLQQKAEKRGFLPNGQSKLRSVFRNESSRHDTAKIRIDERTFRKNVSFDSADDNASPGGVHHARSASLDDHHVNMHKAVAHGKGHEVDESNKDHMDDDTMRHLAAKNYGYNLADFPIPVTQNLSSFSGHARERARYSVYHGNSNVKKKFRVRPYHCFPDETETMTEEKIYAESLTPSKEFIPLKSYLMPSTKYDSVAASIPNTIRQMWGSPDEDGRIGALRVEVLGCVGLNRTKPDVSVYLVCGDAAFCTDVLTGYRSPIWPSVSRRACIFPIHHAYAKLYIGVFDVRIRKNKENDVFCGRVAVDVAAIRPNTEYDTTLPLRASTFVYDKRKRGVIRVRFSMHWFNERAAVLSYLKSVESIVESCPLVEGQPSIPCADPKTFRNVAITVYGQDLPGKYSRNAFRATAREFTLYQQNLRAVCKVIVLDAMLYEDPWISLYLFCASIYCVLFNSVALVPPVLMGYVLILYIGNYNRYVENRQSHFGYKPLTITEIFKALVLNREIGDNELSLESIAVDKQTKRRHRDPGNHLKHDRGPRDHHHDTVHDKDDNNGEIVPMDHREFPFSDRDAYPKFSVEEAIAAGSSKKNPRRLHGRLSVYYSTEAPTTADIGSGEDDVSDVESENDDETVMTESQMIGDSIYNLDSDHDEDEDDIIMKGSEFAGRQSLSPENSAEPYCRRLRVGPPQDSDKTNGNKIPPQIHLKRVEMLLYKFSGSLSVEMVHAPPILEKSGSSITDNVASSGMTMPSPALQDKMAKKTKKMIHDDFDKLLGLHSGSSNPVYRIMSSFLGPLMRMIRVGVYLTRISFNVTTWRDPYLSFWVLVMLVSLCLLLVVFPWRMFFLVSSVVCLGPQVRNHPKTMVIACLFPSELTFLSRIFLSENISKRKQVIKKKKISTKVIHLSHKTNWLTSRVVMVWENHVLILQFIQKKKTSMLYLTLVGVFLQSAEINTHLILERI
jgi:C2 domain